MEFGAQAVIGGTVSAPPRAEPGTAYIAPSPPGQGFATPASETIAAGSWSSAQA